MTDTKKIIAHIVTDAVPVGESEVVYTYEKTIIESKDTRYPLRFSARRVKFPCSCGKEQELYYNVCNYCSVCETRYYTEIYDVSPDNIEWDQPILSTMSPVNAFEKWALKCDIALFIVLTIVISAFPSVFLFDEISVLIERIGIVLYVVLVAQFFTYPLIVWKTEIDQKKFEEDMHNDLWM